MAFVLAAVTGLALALMAAFESVDTANLADIAPLPLASGTSATRAGGGRHRARETGVIAVHARVRIDAAAHLGRIPPSFLGISTEYGALSLFEQHASLFARVLSLLRTPGEGPLIVRVGGDSADHAFWDPSGRPAAHWALGLTPTWFRQTAQLARRVPARLIVDLNLATASPAAAGRLAAQAERRLPHHAIIGFEIGNEPDLYGGSASLATIAAGGVRPAVRSRQTTRETYAMDFSAYARILAGIAPGVKLVGPALAYPRINQSWITTLLATPHTELGTVSAHLYPYTPCVGRRSAKYPTLARLLSQNAAAHLASIVANAVGMAHRAGLAFRLTELNSVNCGGLPGVSNTFATALWVPDALFELLRGGVDGVNVHVREEAINGAFAVRDRGLIARPLLYGLILFARTLGPHAQLAHVEVHSPSTANLKVWAVRVAGGRLHVLVLDKSDHPVHVGLRLRAGGAATVQRLLAPSLRSRFGVRLGGLRLGRAGRWEGTPARETIVSGPHGYQLSMPRFSAALVTFTLAASHPRRARRTSDPSAS